MSSSRRTSLQLSRVPSRLLFALLVIGSLLATQASAGELGAWSDSDGERAAELYAALESSDHSAVERIRNELIVAEAEAGAVGWNDPSVSLTAFALTPETRVGPQRLSARVMQPWSWSADLQLEREALNAQRSSVASEEQVVQLNLISMLRPLLLRRGHLERRQAIVEQHVAQLDAFERLARDQYAAGSGASHDVIGLQSTITSAQLRLTNVRREIAEIESMVRTLVERDLPEIPRLAVGPVRETAAELAAISVDELIARARNARPEYAGIDARLVAQQAKTKLNERAGRPRLKFGLTYTWVDDRDDPAALMMRPEDDGQDVLGLMAEVSIPIFDKPRRARTAASIAKERVLESQTKTVDAALVRDIERGRSRLASRLEELDLIDDLLIPQVEEAERATLIAYESASASALELVESERRLFDARIGRNDAEFDLALAVMEIEHAVGSPLYERGAR